MRLAEEVVDREQPIDFPREVLVLPHGRGERLRVARLGLALKNAAQALVEP
ncbi:hypothetical protein [Frigoriglobus tundricola]|uniref:hypothetical protein n=1 Tax=Frigoriglobus tundricola TaxID=2774151 RepID=UPI00148ED559|nr:hypothetical protein [Frigoriglobus tundricola]